LSPEVVALDPLVPVAVVELEALLSAVVELAVVVLGEALAADASLDALVSQYPPLLFFCTQPVIVVSLSLYF